MSSSKILLALCVVAHYCWLKAQHPQFLTGHLPVPWLLVSVIAFAMFAYEVRRFAGNGGKIAQLITGGTIIATVLVTTQRWMEHPDLDPRILFVSTSAYIIIESLPILIPLILAARIWRQI